MSQLSLLSMNQSELVQTTGLISGQFFSFSSLEVGLKTV